MSAREWANEHPTIVTSVAVLGLCLALAVLIWQGTGRGAAALPSSFYLDLDTGEFFVADGDAVPPIQTPSGGIRGMRAQIFACGECPIGIRNMTIEELVATSAFVAWLERYPADDRDILERYRQRDRDEPFDVDEEMRAFAAEERGPLIQRPGDTQWVTMESRAAMHIMDISAERCAGGEPAVPCAP